MAIEKLPSVHEAAPAIMSGSLHPRELVDFSLARINQFDDRLRAWVLVDANGARREADRLGELARRGEWLGPLHGIPIGIKDIVDVQGWPTCAGSPLRGETPAAADAPVVRRLREAGAILLGKTVTTEFACFDPPPTRNPWDLSRTPGGSSSGSAAAVAMEMCMAAIGSQTGGSITRPASFCGVAGLKATHGAVPLAGVVPISPRLDHVGPIGRSALDLAAVWGAIADNREGEALLAAVLEMPLKLAVIESFFMETADDEVRRATREAIDSICGRGKGERFELPPSFADLATMHRRIMAYDAAAYHRAAFEQSPERFGPHVRALIEFGLATTADQYAEAVAHQRRCRAEFAALLPPGRIAVTPATRTTAPTPETTGDPAFNSPWSYTGLPTVSIPCAVLTDGLPVSLQLIGGPQSEQQLLATAAACEPLLAFHNRPPLLT